MAADLSHKLYDILAAGWRQRYVVIVPMLLMPILGGIVGYKMPPSYQSHTSLLIVETALQNPIMKDLGVPVSLSDRKAGLAELLKSRQVIGGVVDKLGLVKPGPNYEGDREKKIGELNRGLGVSFIGKDMLRINFNAQSNANMKAILQGISDQFVAQIMAPERSALKSSVDFLEAQIKRQRDVLEVLERKMAQFRDAHSDGLPEFFSQNMARLAQLRLDISKKELELAGAQETMASIGRKLARNNPVVGQLEKQIIELRGELALLSARYTAKHSKVQGVTRQLERLEAERGRLMAENDQTSDIERMLNTPVGTSGVDDARSVNNLLVSQLDRYSTAKTQVETLERELDRLRTDLKAGELKSRDTGTVAQKMKEMERDIKIQRDVYEDLQARRERANVTSQLGQFEQSERIKVVDAPFTPQAPTNKQKTIMFVLGGVFAGLALGVSLATVLELLDSTIRSRRVLEALTGDGVPMLARIPPLRAAAAVETPAPPVLKPVPVLKRRASA